MKGSFTEEYVLWELSWNSLMLYMASIPSYDGGKEKEEKPKVKHASELF